MGGLRGSDRHDPRSQARAGEPSSVPGDRLIIGHGEARTAVGGPVCIESTSLPVPAFSPMPQGRTR